MSILRGSAMQLSRDTTATPETPTWSEIKRIGDLTLALEKEEVDASSRDSNNIEEVIALFLKAPLGFELQWRPASDPHCVAIWDAFVAGTEIHLKVSDGQGANERGIRFLATVLKAELQGPLKGMQKLVVSVKPTPGSLAPSLISPA